MQTFVPKASFAKSLQCLDYRRLGKQRLEAAILYNIVSERHIRSGKNYRGWVFHKAALMWVGYPDALAEYHNLSIREWKMRGYNNTMRYIRTKDSFDSPPWVGLRRVHSSHREKLLGKDFDFYNRFRWAEDPAPLDKPYFWPAEIVKKTGNMARVRYFNGEIRSYRFGP